MSTFIQQTSSGIKQKETIISPMMSQAQLDTLQTVNPVMLASEMLSELSKLPDESNKTETNTTPVLVSSDEESTQSLRETLALMVSMLQELINVFLKTNTDKQMMEVDIGQVQYEQINKAYEETMELIDKMAASQKSSSIWDDILSVGTKVLTGLSMLAAVLTGSGAIIAATALLGGASFIDIGGKTLMEHFTSLISDVLEGMGVPPVVATVMAQVLVIVIIMVVMKKMSPTTTANTATNTASKMSEFDKMMDSLQPFTKNMMGNLSKAVTISTAISGLSMSAASGVKAGYLLQQADISEDLGDINAMIQLLKQASSSNSSALTGSQQDSSTFMDSVNTRLSDLTKGHLAVARALARA